jgi:uncharacterized protein YndB with AHSA1/START domain
MSNTRKHEYAIDIAASPEEIWRALAETEGMEKWFAPKVCVTPGPGGSVMLSWGEGCEGTAPIHLWEPGRRIGWTEGPKLIEFEIESIGGGTTRLRMVHSGFDADAKFDQEYESTQGGWQTFLAMLKHATERYSTTPATHVHVMRTTSMPTPVEWEKLIGPQGFAFDSLAEGKPFRARLGGVPIEGSVIRYVKPGYLCLAAENAMLALFVEKAGEGSMVTVQWILFGPAQERAGAIRELLSSQIAVPP